MATFRENEYSPGDGIATENQAEKRPLATTESLATAAGLGLIVLLGAFLRFYQLGAHGIGNSYYAAAVKSMLQSWHNFFFVSFEPGGSVSVDKPPVGFWLQAASAQLLGVNGFSLALPQALAGVLSIPLLFGLVRRQFGNWAGLIAALVLAVMPVTVSTERSNTIDGMLVFVLLLAAWAFWRATRSGRLAILLLGAALVGVAFNVKMLQAYMPLPGFYALYLFGSSHPWRKRIAHLAAATAVLLVVSFSWATAVDLTPAQNRPYVGSSSNNSEMELIFGHNGLARLMPTGWFGISSLNPFGGGSQTAGTQPFGGPQGAGGRGFNGFGGGFRMGQPGLTRLFGEPLVTQASWLLPLALLAIPLLMTQIGRRWQLNSRQQALVLWAGWLLPELAYFSFTQGMFQSYYLIMLGPPLAALVAAGVWSLGQTLQRRHWVGWLMAGLATGITLAFQVATLQRYPDYARWIVPAAIAIWVVGLGLMLWSSRPWLSRAALTLVVVGLVMAPAVWSGATTVSASGLGGMVGRAGPAAGRFPGGGSSQTLLTPQQQSLVNYLEANTSSNGYLLATGSATEAAPYVLATGHPVLTFGGFMGSDNVVNASQLAQMVAAGKIRYVLASPQLARQKPDIAQWLASNARPVSVPGMGQPGAGQAGGSFRGFGRGGGYGGSTLYDCQPN